MNSPLIATAVILGVVCGVAYLLRRFVVRGRRHADFDGGVVSQSWLIEHRASTQDDRFS